MQHNMKRNNIRIIGIPEGEEEEKGIENLFEKVMMENFHQQQTKLKQSSKNSKKEDSKTLLMRPTSS